MPKTLPLEAKTHVLKARESALLAVEIYNKPLITFRSGGYVTLMCVAWTALFHAIFFHRKIKPFYISKNNHRHYEKIDGDYKAWELKTCLDEYYNGITCSERKNLEFFIGLRNKIEHRARPELDIRIFGECQALLFNFEDCLVNEFGSRYALNESLSMALQFSQMRNVQQALAMQKLHSPMAKRVVDYVSNFRSSLTSTMLSDMRFSYKVLLIPRTVNNAGPEDLAVQFIKPDQFSPEDMEKLNQLVTLVKPMTSQVANQGRLKATAVCAKLHPIIQAYVGAGAKFTASSHHVRACEFYKIRPSKGEGDPRKTDTRYCHYDEVHCDYVYTGEWVAFLIEEMKKPKQYDLIISTRTGIRASVPHTAQDTRSSAMVSHSTTSSG